MTSPESKHLTGSKAEHLKKLIAEVIALEKYNRGYGTNVKVQHTLQVRSDSPSIPISQKAPYKRKHETLAIQKYDGFEALLFMAKCGFRFLPWDKKEDRPAFKWSGENQKNFSNDLNKLLKWQAHGYKRYLYLPGISGYIGLDIDCGHADGRDGLLGFYEIMLNVAGKNTERLPYYLRDLPNNLPCWVETPSGGLHVLFKYSGLCKVANLTYKGHKLEVKYLSGCLSLGEKRNGTYILRGNPLDVPELPRFLCELVNPQAKQRLESHRAVCRPRRKDSLEKILGRVLKASVGNNQTQMKFAWRAAYFGHALEEVLAFVKSRPDVFGNGSDTETVVRHSWHSNKERQFHD